MKWPKFVTKSDVNNFSYGLKSIIAQITALTTTYLFSMKVGIDTMTPTIIIGALTENRNSAGHDPLSDISEEQMSWIGSLIYLLPPVGSVVVSFVQDRFGHRVCMTLSNGIQLLSIVALSMFTNSPAGLYANSALLGFNMGFITSFTISYCGEVCDPKMRGTLASVQNLFYFAGYLCVTMLYAITVDWKLSVLITVIVPLLCIAVLFKTPDSPMWLLSKGRTEESKQTLRKLRGGATEEQCTAEFQDMVHYASEINLNNPRSEETEKNATSENWFYSHLVKPETLKPLGMIVIIIFFANILSGIPYTPYLISVFGTFEVPIHPAWATTTYMACGVAGNVLTILFISRLGKRFLALSTMVACSVCYLSIGAIGNFWPSSPVLSWTKIVLFFVSTFFSSMGIMPVVWILMGEIFPMKSKNVGSGVSSAIYFVLCFLMTKFYLNLEAITGFYNTFVLFGAIGLVGLVYLYYQLPETENKTLNEIAEHFKSKPTIIENPTSS